MVHEGSGGLDHISLQLAKYYGAGVYSAGGGESQMALIRDLGVVSINYKTEQVEEYIGEHTGSDDFGLV